MEEGAEDRFLGHDNICWWSQTEVERDSEKFPDKLEESQESGLSENTNEVFFLKHKWSDMFKVTDGN